MCPIDELPAGVRARIGGEPLEARVHDLSVGGVGLRVSDAPAAIGPGVALDLELDLGAFGVHALRAVVRHRPAEAHGVIGCELEGVPPAAFTGLERYVAELLERGAPS